MTLAAAIELRVVNPATLESVGTVPVTDAAGIATRVAGARAAQAIWGEASVREQRAALQRLARLVLAGADEIAETVVAETAKPRVEAFTTELYPALDAVAWLAQTAAAVLAPERLRYPQPHLLQQRGRLPYEPRAVVGGLWASFVNCGQVCSGVERIYVESALYEPFLEELARKARGLKLGDEVGPLISEEQRDRVAALVDEAVDAGAQALVGAVIPERTGWFYEPT